jgi:hypothetical protein
MLVFNDEVHATCDQANRLGPEDEKQDIHLIRSFCQCDIHFRAVEKWNFTFLYFQKIFQHYLIEVSFEA